MNCLKSCLYNTGRRKHLILLFYFSSLFVPAIFQRLKNLTSFLSSQNLIKIRVCLDKKFDNEFDDNVKIIPRLGNAGANPKPGTNRTSGPGLVGSQGWIARSVVLHDYWNYIMDKDEIHDALLPQSFSMRYSEDLKLDHSKIWSHLKSGLF